ncbi:MAG: hypothetical protein ACE5GV_14055, partial [Candidatus Scalindua sp.]
MLKPGGDKRLKAGDEICVFKKDGLLPITCGNLEYFDEKNDKVCINVDKRSVKLTKHLYDLVVRASVLDEAGPEGSYERV